MTHKWQPGQRAVINRNTFVTIDRVTPAGSNNEAAEDIAKCIVAAATEMEGDTSITAEASAVTTVLARAIVTALARGEIRHGTISY